jgi:hypothetical protein
MSFSEPAVKQKTDFNKLSLNLENLGKQEIYLWREMVLKDESLFAAIYHLISSDNPRVAWHAAWVIDHASEAEPDKLEPYVPELIDSLPGLKNSSLKRHFTRMLNRHKIPDDKAGILIDVLYALLSPSEAIAVRANSMRLLCKIALREPDLKEELSRTIQSLLEVEEKPGILSTGRNILRELRHQ